MKEDPKYDYLVQMDAKKKRTEHIYKFKDVSIIKINNASTHIVVGSSNGHIEVYDILSKECVFA